MTNSAVARRLEPLLRAELVATCAIVDLEVLYSTRTGDQWNVIASERAAMPRVPVTEAICARAIEVQGLLWNAGKVRAVGIPDLLIAAAAEASRITVLHYDGDFDHIAEITGQSCEWVVPKGYLVA